MNIPASRSIAIIGVGPRGTSLLERLGAVLEPDDGPLEVHLIDPEPFGAGAVWRTDQEPSMCMNTLSHAVTLFTEPGGSIRGPVVPGPTLYEWSMLILHRDFPDTQLTQHVATFPPEHVHTFNAAPPSDGVAHRFRTELETTRPESHPSRALYGEYLIWCLTRAIALLPTHTRIVKHRSTCVATEAVDGGERLTLASGHTITVNHAIIATGWRPRTPGEADRELVADAARFPHLTRVRPDSPIRQELSAARPGEEVIVRGLGMGFFDTLTLLTLARGGEFIVDHDTVAGLRYRPSGREPIVHVTSRRGVPFLAKSLYGGLPPAPPQTLTREAVRTHPAGTMNFNTALWPSVVADAFLAHAHTLHRTHPERVPGPLHELERDLRALTHRRSHTDDPIETVHTIATLTTAYIPNPQHRFHLESLLTEHEQHFPTPEAFHRWVVRRTEADLAEARRGVDSAYKAGLWSLSAARGVAGRAGTQGRFDAESRNTGYALLAAVGGMAGSGPPAFRIQQLLALEVAGLVKFLGPAGRIEVAGGTFVASSPRVTGSGVRADILIDAWMHAHRLAETRDPLFQSLRRQGRVRAFTVPARSGERVTTGAVWVDPDTAGPIDHRGEASPTLSIVGIPAEEQHHGTIISPMPGTDPPMLAETDRVMVHVVARLRASVTELQLSS